LLLDNQADVSVFHPVLLMQIMPAEKPIQVSGIGGRQLEVENTGDPPDFFRFYATKHTTANVLCLADVEDAYKVMYIMQTAFIVHLPSRDLEFHIVGKHYIADREKPQYVQTIVQENSAEQLGLSLQGHLNTLRARGFIPITVHVDPQAGFCALKGQFPGVLIDDG
jgi:hypothetical protein